MRPMTYTVFFGFFCAGSLEPASLSNSSSKWIQNFNNLTEKGHRTLQPDSHSYTIGWNTHTKWTWVHKTAKIYYRITNRRNHTIWVSASSKRCEVMHVSLLRKPEFYQETFCRWTQSRRSRMDATPCYTKKHCGNHIIVGFFHSSDV